MIAIPFLKACFRTKNTRKGRKLCTPLWKLGSQKSSETTIFIGKLMGTSYWPNQVDQLLTLKPQMWTSYWPYSIYATGVQVLGLLDFYSHGQVGVTLMSKVQKHYKDRHFRGQKSASSMAGVKI